MRVQSPIVWVHKVWLVGAREGDTEDSPPAADRGGCRVTRGGDVEGGVAVEAMRDEVGIAGRGAPRRVEDKGVVSVQDAGGVEEQKLHQGVEWRVIAEGDEFR